MSLKFKDLLHNRRKESYIINKYANICLQPNRGYGKLLLAMKHLRRYLEFMNRSQLVDKIAHKAELTKKDAEKFLTAYIDSVIEALQEDDKVSLVGFGTFEVRERAARQGRNLHTGETIEIEASKYPAFKAGKALKDALK